MISYTINCSSNLLRVTYEVWYDNLVGYSLQDLLLAEKSQIGEVLDVVRREDAVSGSHNVDCSSKKISGTVYV